MATDPPAAHPLPELADLDPAFDLTTFATEGSPASAAVVRARPRAAVRPVALEELPAPPDFSEDLPRRAWLTDSAIQLAIAGLLAVGAIVIVLLAVRGRQPSTADEEPQPQVATDADAPAPQPSPVPPPAARPKRETARSDRPVDRTPAVRTTSEGRAVTPVSTTGRSALPTAASAQRSATASPRAARVPAAVIERSSINVNAVPWANVWLDGREIGETPLANVPVTVGAHELVFRHPELGERRVLATVEAGVQSRVTADLRR